MRGDPSGFLDVTQRMWIAEIARRCTRAYWDADHTEIIDHVSANLPRLEGPTMVNLAGDLNARNLRWKTQAIKQIAGTFETFAEGIFALNQVDRQQVAIQRARRVMKPDVAQQWVETVDTGPEPINFIPASVSKSRLASKRQPMAARTPRDKGRRSTDLSNRPPLAAKRMPFSGKSRHCGRRRAAPERKFRIDLTIDSTELRHLLQTTLQVPVSIAPELYPVPIASKRFPVDMTPESEPVSIKSEGDSVSIPQEVDPAAILLQFAEHSDAGEARKVTS